MDLMNLFLALGLTIIRWIFYGAEVIILLLTFQAPYRRRETVPRIQDNILYLSATQLAEKIRKRELKCIEVIEAYINRIQKVDPLLNSVVDIRFKEALDDARSYDILLDKNPDQGFWKKTKPLLGVPLTVKETIGVKGLSNNAARSRVASNIAKQDAETVSLLRNAGMIPLVVTNIPELCLYWETDNPKHGRTNNPYDLRRTPGGSSGGEGALLGAGASVVGLGSDIGGSIRLPCLFCGVFGHKPTPGFVSNKGHIPTATDPQWDMYFSICPMTRYACDLPLVLKAMIPEKNKPKRLELDEEVDLSKLKIFFMFGEGEKSILTDPVSQDMKDALIRAAFKLEVTYRCPMREIRVESTADSITLSSVVLRVKGIESIYQEADDLPEVWKDVPSKIIKKITLQSSASIPAVFFGPLKMFVDLLPDSVISKAENKIQNLQQYFNELLGEDGVLLYPTFPNVAPFHMRMGYQFLNSSYMILFTLLGLPITQCPIGLDKNGLPLGIQVVAAKGKDKLTLAVARALEELCGGWRPPS